MYLTTGVVYAGVCHIKNLGQGWMEKYFINRPSMEAAIDGFGKLLKFRRNLLGPAAEITWARCSDLSVKRQTFAAIDYPIAGGMQAEGAETVDDSHDNDTGLRIRLETEEGYVSNRLIRGVPDKEIAALKLVETTPYDFDSVVDVTSADTLATYKASFEAFVQFLLAYTHYMTPLATTPPTFGWKTWSNAVYRGVGRRPTGRPFGQSRGRALAA